VERFNKHGICTDAVLKINIIEGREIMPMDMTGKSDPYVVLKMGDQTYKTKHINQNLNPIWNEVATFDVETGHEVVEVEVFDRDDFGKDDFEGGFTIRLDNS
jgi:Ca2+-dependent lipid-binding protein